MDQLAQFNSGTFAYTQKDIGIYIGFPFCRQKCHFCDWVQRIPKSDLLRKPEDSVRRSYVEALCLEIRTKGASLKEEGYTPRVIYWGGGTATSMTFHETEQIMCALEDVFDMCDVREFTIEGSPDTMTPESLWNYKEYGFNRISVGIQSFNDARLKKLGRRHNLEQSIQVVENARRAGFDDINIDLMCGFAEETTDEVRSSVNVAIDLAPSHISLYTFRPTEGTVMRRAVDRKLVELNISRQLNSYAIGRGLLIKAGYDEYGVGYFGREAENVTGMFGMWFDVVGFGSGATSYFKQRYLGHTAGNLEDYLSNPLEYDFQDSMLSQGVALSALRSGLAIFAGIESKNWEARVGESLTESLKRPDFRRLIEILDVTDSMNIDAERISLKKEKAALVVVGLMNAAMM